MSATLSPSPTNRRIAGIVQLTINGNTYNASDVVYSPSAVRRASLKDQTAVAGYSEMPETCYIAATIRDAGDLDSEASLHGTNVDINIQTASGKSVYGAGMWSVEPLEVRTTEGQIPVRYEGPIVTESPV